MTDIGFSPGCVLAIGVFLVSAAVVLLWTPTHSANAWMSTAQANAQPVASFSQPTHVAAVTDVVADTSVPEYDLRAIEREIHEGINAERTQHKLSLLTYADSLHRLGIVHSRDMAQRGFFGHNNPEGEGVNDRATALGLSCVRTLDEQTTARGFGENLYRGSLFNRYRDIFQNGQRIRREFDWKTESDIATDVVRGWMDSPGHRANILEEQYATEAIAFYADGTDFFVTQIFC